MKLIFDHTLGKQEHQDLVICKPLAEVMEEEENDDDCFKREYTPDTRNFLRQKKNLQLRTLKTYELDALVVNRETVNGALNMRRISF